MTSNKKIRTLYYLKLSKLKNIKCLYFLDCRSNGWVIAISSFELNIGRVQTIQNDHCVTGNKIKDQPVQNKYEIKRTINIKNDTSTAAKEKITNSDSTSGLISYVYSKKHDISLSGIIVSSQSPRNHLVVAQSSKPKPEKLPVELPVLNPDLIKKSHLKQDPETSGMDLKEH